MSTVKGTRGIIFIDDLFYRGRLCKYKHLDTDKLPFKRYRKGGHCVQCEKLDVKKNHTDKLRYYALRHRKIRLNLRHEVFNHYGNKCNCCGESKHPFLSIDHIKGNGNKHRKEIGLGSGGVLFYEWLKKQGFPKEFRILCHNCNQAQGTFGYCPHENWKEQEICRCFDESTIRSKYKVTKKDE